MKEYWVLFWAMAKVGVMTFGGGYAMLPILQRELVDTRRWVKESELVDWFAIGQCTPGVIAVNVATFVGQKRKGVLGGVAATAGMVFPSFVIISLVAALVQNFSSLAIVQNAFAGIRVCVCVLILNAVLKLWRAGVVDLPTLVIFLLVFFGSLLLPLSPIAYVVCAGAAGIFLAGHGYPKKRGAEKKA